MATSTTTRPALSDAELLDQLLSCSTEGLLTAAYSLTHRIHEAQRAPVTCARQGDYEDDLRAQRDAITAEIVRRAS